MNISTKSQKDLARVILAAIAVSTIFGLFFLSGYLAWYLASVILTILPPWVGGGAAMFWLVCSCFD